MDEQELKDRMAEAADEVYELYWQHYQETSNNIIQLEGSEERKRAAERVSRDRKDRLSLVQKEYEETLREEVLTLLDEMEEKGWEVENDIIPDFDELYRVANNLSEISDLEVIERELLIQADQY